MTFKAHIAVLIKRWLTFLLTVIFFIVATILMDIAAKADGVWSVMHTLAAMTRLCYIFLLIVLVSGIAKYFADIKQAEKDQKKQAKKAADELAALEAQTAKAEQPEPAPTAVAETATEAAPEAKAEPSKKKKKIVADDDVDLRLYVKLFYALGLVAMLIACIIQATGTYPLFTYAFVANISVVHIILLFICLLFGFVLHKWISVKKDDGERHLLLGLLSVYEILFALTLFGVCMMFIFKINYMYVLNWVYLAVHCYLVLAIILGVVKAIIKKAFILDFDYIVVFWSRNSGESLLSIIEKNTGLSFKSMWSLKFVIKLIPSVILAAGFILFLSTSIYKVESYQSAVVYRFGTLQTENVEPGLHIKLPYPIDKVEIYDVTRVDSIQIGYVSSGTQDFLWTESHDGGEYKLVLNNGIELVSINMKLVYNIDDLAAYLTNYAQPEKVLSAKAYEILMEKTVNSTLDAVLCVDRENLSEAIKTSLAEYSEFMGLGLKVSDVVIESIHPPVEVAEAYQSAVSAVIEKKTLITNAETYAAETEIAAEGKKESVVLNAQEEQSKAISETTANLAVYYAAFAAYEESPESFVLSEYLQTYSKVISNSGKVYLFSPNIGEDLSDFLIGGGSSVVVGAVVNGSEG